MNAEAINAVRAVVGEVLDHEADARDWSAWAAAGLTSLAVPEGSVVVVVGPEGGIAPEELAALTDAGAVSVRLGAEVLRTSTAGVAAVAALLSRTSRWG